MNNNYYKGNKNWKEEFNNILNDIEKFYTNGKADMLSKKREIKTLTLGLHYSTENSYQRLLIEQSHYIDISNLQIMSITKEKSIFIEININYYYYYLKEGNGLINNLPFSGYGIQFYNIF